MILPVTHHPADGSASKTPPSAIVFEFSRPVQLHGAFIKKDEERSKSLGGLPQIHAKTITVPAPLLTPGHYLLEWQAFTDESHVLSGRIRFTVSADTVAAAASTQ